VYAKIIKSLSDIHEPPAQLNSLYTFSSFVSLHFLLRLFVVKLRKATISSSFLSICPSVCVFVYPHSTSRFPLDG